MKHNNKVEILESDGNKIILEQRKQPAGLYGAIFFALIFILMIYTLITSYNWNFNTFLAIGITCLSAVILVSALVIISSMEIIITVDHQKVEVVRRTLFGKKIFIVPSANIKAVRNQNSPMLLELRDGTAFYLSTTQNWYGATKIIQLVASFLNVPIAKGYVDDPLKSRLSM